MVVWADNTAPSPLLGAGARLHRIVGHHRRAIGEVATGSPIVGRGWRPAVTGCAMIAAITASSVTLETASPEQQARAAIITAVRARLGPRADVRLDDFQLRGDLQAPVVAVPTPGARTAARIRFVLSSGTARAARTGEAEAIVSVSMPHFRVGQWVRRGSDLEVDALDEQVGDIGSVPLSPLPSRAALSGATAARDIAPGEVITPASVTLASFVKTGDKVIVHATIKGLDIQATVVAAQGGRLGDLIRCVNPDTRHTMMVRIIGHGVGEVGLAF